MNSVTLRERNRRRTWAIAIAVMIGLAGLAIFAFIQQGKAVENLETANDRLRLIYEGKYDERIKKAEGYKAIGKVEPALYEYEQALFFWNDTLQNYWSDSLKEARRKEFDNLKDTIRVLGGSIPSLNAPDTE